MPPAKKTIGLRELRVGLLVVVSIVVLILLLLNASGDFAIFAQQIPLRARFASADGLRPGSEVRLAGVRIGKVDEVSLLPPTDTPTDPRVLVQFSVNSTIDGRPASELIRTDSTAQLGSPSLLGADKIINITPGTSLGQPVTPNYELSATTAGGMADLTASGQELVDRLERLTVEVTDIARKINEGEGTIGRFINDEAFYNNLNATLRDVQDITRQLRAGQGTAGQLLNNPALYNNLDSTVTELRVIAENLRQGRGTAGRLLTDEALYNEARSTIARLDRSASEINQMIADVRAGRGTIGRLLTDEAIYNDAREAIARFNTATERIDNMVAGIQRGEGTVGRLMTDDQLYNNVNQLSAEGVKLIYDFRQNPRRYLTVRFSIF